MKIINVINLSCLWFFFLYVTAGKEIRAVSEVFLTSFTSLSLHPYFFLLTLKMIAWADLSIKFLSDLLLENVSQMLPRATFWATCWKQLVESNLLPVATFEQLFGNKLLSTSCFQHVAQKSCSGQHLGNIFQQQVA